mgnify:CR=1 FL=1
MDMIPVSSSNVESIGYEDGVIEVHFHNGYAYRYPNCSEELFSQFLNASSKGSFVHRVVVKFVFANPNLLQKEYGFPWILFPRRRL